MYDSYTSAIQEAQDAPWKNKISWRQAWRENNKQCEGTIRQDMNKQKD